MRKVEYLKAGTRLNNGRYVIQANLTPGIDCLTYLANDGQSIIKEYCPNGAVRNEDGSLEGCEYFGGFKRLANLQRRIADGVIGINSLATYDLFEENNTMYFVCDFSGSGIAADFVAYTVWYERDHGRAVFHNSYDDFVKANIDKMTLYDMIYPIWLAAHVIHEYHRDGYVHVNLKPEKLLVSTDSDNRPVAVQVLETGSMVNEGYYDGRLVVTSRWSAPELVTASVPFTDARCDVYSLGMMLLKSVIAPLDEVCDLEYTMPLHSDYPFEKSECDCVVSTDEIIKKKLANVFEHSIKIIRECRYATALQFADALADIIRNLSETDLEAFEEEEARIREWRKSI